MKITKINAASTYTNSKLKVAAYARVSTGSDAQEESLTVQREHYESFIKSNPEWEFAGIYFDEAISGTKTEKRDGLKRMLKDAENGKIDRILVKSISRFSRNTVRTLQMVRRLTQINVSIFFEKENIDSAGMQSELLLTALSSFAESESRSISANTKWGVKKRFEDGTYIYGCPTLGYKNVKGETVIDEEKAELVKRIFKLAQEGNGCNKIARALEAEGIPAPKGKTWYSSTVKDILSNVAYVGDLLLQKTYSDENFNRRNNKGEKKQYLVKNHHEPIIDQETFDEVQKGIEKRRKLSGIKKDTNIYLQMTSLSGKIVCGDCGSKFKKFKNNTARYPEVAWHCSGKVKDVNSCSIKAIKEAALKNAILKSMKKLRFSSKELLIPYLDAIKSAHDEKTLQRIETLEDDVAKILDEENTLLTLLTNNIIDSNIYHLQRAELEAKRNEQLKTLDLINKNDTARNELVEATEALIADVTKKKEIEVDDYISMHIVSILVKDRNNIVINMKCGIRLKERIDRPW